MAVTFSQFWVSFGPPPFAFRLSRAFRGVDSSGHLRTQATRFGSRLENGRAKRCAIQPPLPPHLGIMNSPSSSKPLVGFHSSPRSISWPNTKHWRTTWLLFLLPYDWVIGPGKRKAMDAFPRYRQENHLTWLPGPSRIRPIRRRSDKLSVDHPESHVLPS